MSVSDTIEPPIAVPRFAFDNSYARELPGCYVPWTPSPAPAPRLIKLNHALAQELALDPQELSQPGGLAVFAGNAVPEGAQPLAQAYAGHQFGGYSPQLGDGRALLLGELIDSHGQRRDIALKGSGRTPFGVRGDGRAALGPVLREYLMGEAMHALGIPTTRALAAVTTGEPIWRDRLVPGAVLTRIAASHIRVGTFQYFANQPEDLIKLADYVIARHAPELLKDDRPYLALLQQVADKQAALIARWMGIGFIHGVMNTDNMAIAGETIDYGPCAFMEAYDPNTVFSSIDVNGRYAYGNQPIIAQWNLARFAETLLPLIHPSADDAFLLATKVIEAFPANYQTQWLNVLRAKLGLDEGIAADDHGLAADFLELLYVNKVDFTLGFRRLIDAMRDNDQIFLDLLGEGNAAGDAWLQRWHERLNNASSTPEEQEARMLQANPIYIPRNHQVEAALAAAVDDNDLTRFERLLEVVQHPFDERPGLEDYTRPAPPELTAEYRTFCGT